MAASPFRYSLKRCLRKLKAAGVMLFGVNCVTSSIRLLTQRDYSSNSIQLNNKRYNFMRMDNII